MGIRSIFFKLILLSLLLVVSCFTVAFDVIDESVIWPNVAQGHSGGNYSSCNVLKTYQLSMQSGSRINGTLGQALDFCSSNSNFGMPNDSCDDGAGGVRKCTITRNKIVGLKMEGTQAFKKNTGNDGGIGYCNAGQNLTLGADGKNQFATVELYAACTLTMSASQSEYQFKKLHIGAGAKVLFPEGDYWIDDLFIDNTCSFLYFFLLIIFLIAFNSSFS